MRPLVTVLLLLLCTALAHAGTIKHSVPLTTGGGARPAPSVVDDANDDAQDIGSVQRLRDAFAWLTTDPTARAVIASALAVLICVRLLLCFRRPAAAAKNPTPRGRVW